MPTDNGTPTFLNSATRRIPKATYVPLITILDDSTAGRAVPKFGYIRQLSLQAGEVDAARHALLSSKRRGVKKSSVLNDSSLWTILRSFEGSPMPSQLPSPTMFAHIPSAALLIVGKAIVTLRQQALTEPTRPLSPAASPLLDQDSVRGLKQFALNAANVAVKGFEKHIATSPIGMLNLERLEMTPAGIERGELLATIPLAPKERTAVVHKEWSVTTKEFTSIVTDSLENYSETGVTEKSELAQAVKSQSEHNNQLSINATVQGSYPFVTATAATQFASQDKDSRSAEESRKHAVDTTRKASARVKQEHKMTISTTTVTGTSDTTTRHLENPSDTNPIRIDYFSMMRKWHVGLYRYDLRMTYDIAIPEPGGALRAVYRDLAKLRIKIGLPFIFPVKHKDITSATYQQLADDYGAQVSPPPEPEYIRTYSDTPSAGPGWHFHKLDIEVPPDYRITEIKLFARVGGAGNKLISFGVDGTDFELPNFGSLGHHFWPPITLTANGVPFLLNAVGRQNITFWFHDAGPVSVGVEVHAAPTPTSTAVWVSSVWAALYNAAQAAFYIAQQALTSSAQALEDKISGVDTLTLRREEHDEIMKGVLRWLLGTDFHFMPLDVRVAFMRSDLSAAKGGATPADDPYGKVAEDLLYGVSFTGSELGLPSTDWTIMYQYQEMVKFINEAIEWEHMIYFSYSYFWDVPASWDFIRQLRHPDATRQAFLRAGSARVVLPVRKNYEVQWMNFVELGDFGRLLPPGHPYRTIAQTIHDYANTNYPGIPPANPAGASALDSVATRSHEKVSGSTKGGDPVTILVESSDGFSIGHKVVIDTFQSKVQESQIVTDVPDATHITVETITNQHDGRTTPFPLLQPGEKGVLMSEWYEYTPTSGTDIAITSNLATIA